MPKIIERFEFRNDNNQELIDLIIEELNFHQIDPSLALKVKDAILRIINISLGSELQNKKQLIFQMKAYLRRLNMI